MRLQRLQQCLEKQALNAGNIKDMAAKSGFISRMARHISHAAKGSAVGAVLGGAQQALSTDGDVLQGAIAGAAVGGVGGHIVAGSKNFASKVSKKLVDAAKSGA